MPKLMLTCMSASILRDFTCVMSTRAVWQQRLFESHTHTHTHTQLQMFNVYLRSTKTFPYYRISLFSTLEKKF